MCLEKIINIAKDLLSHKSEPSQDNNCDKSINITVGKGNNQNSNNNNNCNNNNCDNKQSNITMLNNSHNNQINNNINN